MSGCGDTEQSGVEGLVELNRAARRHPNQTRGGDGAGGAGVAAGAHAVGAAEAEARVWSGISRGEAGRRPAPSASC